MRPYVKISQLSLYLHRGVIKLFFTSLQSSFAWAWLSLFESECVKITLWDWESTLTCWACIDIFCRNKTQIFYKLVNVFHMLYFISFYFIMPQNSWCDIKVTHCKSGVTWRWCLEHRAAEWVLWAGVQVQKIIRTCSSTQRPWDTMLLQISGSDV